MKTNLLSLFLSASVAFAQILPPAGEEIKGAKLKETVKALEAAGVKELKTPEVTVPLADLTALSASSARYMNSSGIGRITLADLPEETRKKIGYNPNSAAGHDQAKEAMVRKAENDATAILQKEKDDAARAAWREKMRAQVIRESIAVEVKVSQTFDNGAKIYWVPMKRDPEVFTPETEGFLVGYTKGVADGDKFVGRIYPAGRYKAKLAISGAPVVLRAWAASPDEAVKRIESGEE